MRQKKHQEHQNIDLHCYVVGQFLFANLRKYADVRKMTDIRYI